MKVPVVLFGSVPLATWVAKRIVESELTDLVGVVCQRKSRKFLNHNLDIKCVYDFARAEGIRILSMDDLADFVGSSRECLGISVRFHRILSDRIITLFERGIINLHGGELPRYRGVNIANHCILEGATQGGATLHYIDKGIDTGPIIARGFFEISNTDTSYDVFLKTQIALMKLIREHLEDIILGKVQAVPQQVYIEKGEQAKTYYRRDIEGLKRIDFSMSREAIFRCARAFDFPGHEPAYFVFQDSRFYLTTQYG